MAPERMAARHRWRRPARPPCGRPRLTARSSTCAVAAAKGYGPRGDARPRAGTLRSCRPRRSALLALQPFFRRAGKVSPARLRRLLEVRRAGPSTGGDGRFLHRPRPRASRPARPSRPRARTLPPILAAQRPRLGDALIAASACLGLVPAIAPRAAVQVCRTDHDCVFSCGEKRVSRGLAFVPAPRWTRCQAARRSAEPVALRATDA